MAPSPADQRQRGLVGVRRFWQQAHAGCWLFVALSGAVPAWAGADADADPVALPDIVVTARRVEELAFEVPISMVVLDGRELDRAGLSSVTDLPERVPGLNVSIPNARLATLSIRGLGSPSGNDGLESSVGLFVDGAYLGRQGISVFDLVDIERIEVLRGPQGTLFGKNTTAGTINIITRAPTPDFAAEIESSFGNDSRRQLRGSLNGPLLGSSLSGRINGYLTDAGGTIDNLYDGGRLNDRHRAGARGQLLWTPTETLRGRFIAEIGRLAEHCCTYPLLAPVRAPVAASDAYEEYRRSSTNPYDRVADNDVTARSDAGQQALTADISWQLQPEARLTSLSSWRHWRFLPINDDATSLKLVTNGTLTEQRQFTQEFRLDQHVDALATTLGLFYLHQDTSGNQAAVLGEDLSDYAFGGLIRQRLPLATRSNTGLLLHALIPQETLAGMRISTPYRQHTDSLAGFGNADWALSDRLSVSGGLRYTYDAKRASVSRSRSGGNINASPLALTNDLTPLGDLIGQDLSGLTFDSFIDNTVGGAYQRSNRRSEGNVSGQTAVAYRLVDTLTLYASAARGYKSGGINLGASGVAVKPTFKPEIATALEAGAKGQFLDQRLSMTLALYRTRVQDYQALTFDEESTLLPDPRQLNLLNVGAVRLQGVEASFEASPLRRLQLRGAVAYNQAITTDFRNAPNPDTRRNDMDLSGRQLYNAPRWTLSAGIENVQPLGNALLGFAGVDTSYRSATFGALEQGASSRIAGYDLLNLRTGLRAGDRRWELTLWVRNLLDTHYIAAMYAIYGVGDYGAFAGDARSYGVTLQARFD